MNREKLYLKLVNRFGVSEGHNKYSKITDLLSYTYNHINECGFPTDFYDKIVDIIL